MSMKTIERPAVSHEAILPVRNVGLWIVVAAAVSLLVGGLVWAIVRSPAVEEPAAAQIGWSAEARAAEAARWAARAEVYARVRAQQAESDRLGGIAVYTLPELFNRAQQAEADRLTGIAEFTLPEILNRAQQAEADRLTGIALAAGLTPAQQAESARWGAYAEAFRAERARDAWTDRLTGLAVYTLPEMLDRAQQAEADRLTGLAVYTLPDMLNRAQQAEADRLTGLAEYMGR